MTAAAPAPTPQAKSEGPIILETRGLVKNYGGRNVVNSVDINCRSGEIVGLLGPNGAGKTTTFYMMVGLVRPTAGRVFFNGEDVTDLAMYKRAMMGMGYLPQEESIFRKLTVEQNLMAILETTNMKKPQRKARCEELLAQFGIAHVRSQLALTLSGGEKRRLTIARSLVTSPSLIMLDEPFAGVDPLAVEDIQNIVSGLRTLGIGIVITDHNARVLLDVVDRAYIIYEGRVLMEGPSSFLVNNEDARRLYLGENFRM